MEEQKDDILPEEETTPEVQAEETPAYIPRPKWQVWGARVALVVFILGLVLYYCNIFGVAR